MNEPIKVVVFDVNYIFLALTSGWLVFKRVKEDLENNKYTH